MRLRILLEPHHGATYAQILALAQAAEAGGFDAFFRSDHYLGIDADDTTYQPTDSWTTLAGLGVQTERVRLGPLVNASTFRLPGQLAVEVATVDQMSGGRAELGIGAAWYEREHDYFGIPFPPLGERFDKLEEQLAILTGLWDTKPGERFSFTGKHYKLQDCASIPRWASRPKIIVGGAGAKRTPTLAARYADEFNGALGLDLRERYANFTRICADVVGRAAHLHRPRRGRPRAPPGVPRRARRPPPRGRRHRLRRRPHPGHRRPRRPGRRHHLPASLRPRRRRPHRAPRRAGR